MSAKSPVATQWQKPHTDKQAGGGRCSCAQETRVISAGPGLGLAMEGAALKAAAQEAVLGGITARQGTRFPH